MEGWILGCLAAIFMVSMRILAAIYDIGERPIKMLEPVQPPQKPIDLPIAQIPQESSASRPAGTATIKQSATMAETLQTAATSARTMAGTKKMETKIARPQITDSETIMARPPIVRQPAPPKIPSHSWPKQDRKRLGWPELQDRPPQTAQPIQESCDPQDL